MNHVQVEKPDIDCERVCALLRSLGDGEPSPEIVQEIVEHFSRCDRCIDAEASLERLLALYRAQAEPARQQLESLETRLLEQLCGRC